MEIAKIVKYLQKEKYAEFLSEICCMHFYQNYQNNKIIGEFIYFEKKELKINR